MAFDRVGLRRRWSDELQANHAAAVEHHAEAEELVEHCTRDHDGRRCDSQPLQDANQSAHEPPDQGEPTKDACWWVRLRLTVASLLAMAGQPSRTAHGLAQP